MNNRLRKAVGAVLVIALIGLGRVPTFQTLAALPSYLQVAVGQESALQMPNVPFAVWVEGQGLRVVQPGHQLRLTPEEPGHYRVHLRVWGVPVSTLNVDAVPTIRVVPGGQSVGVLVQAQGVLVVKTEAIDSGQGRADPAADADLRVGDVILAINGTPVRNKEQARALVEAAAPEGPIHLLVLREGVRLEKSIRPIWDPAARRSLLGIWVRDGASGVGTLTFYDPDQGLYGALGHMVTDATTGQPYPMGTGAIVRSLVSGVDPGRRGQPGEKIGVLMNPEQPLGTIDQNSAVGIFGHLQQVPASWRRQPVPIATESQIHPGPATMLTVVQGQRVEAFQVEIERVLPQQRTQGKGLVVRVTDPRLLEQTGGIIQGMSGSPLLQDGRLIGAVTHVFVNDPTRGYGVLAIWMAEEAGLVPGHRVSAWP